MKEWRLELEHLKLILGLMTQAFVGGLRTNLDFDLDLSSGDEDSTWTQT